MPNTTIAERAKAAFRNHQKQEAEKDRILKEKENSRQIEVLEKFLTDLEVDMSDIILESPEFEVDGFMFAVKGREDVITATYHCNYCGKRITSGKLKSDVDLGRFIIDSKCDCDDY